MTEDEPVELSEEEQERIERSQEALMGRIELILSNAPPAEEDPEDIERDRHAGRENRERRREIVRRARLDKWDKLSPPRYSDATLANIDNSKLRKVVTDWLADPTTNVVLLSENSGVGKTFIARSIARELYAEGFSVEFHQLSELFEKITPSGSDEFLFNRVLDSQILVLDDVGVEKLSEWRIEKLHMILNHRWEWNLPVIVTSNLTKDVLAEWLGQRAYSRLMGDALVMQINGKDKRLGV